MKVKTYDIKVPYEKSGIYDNDLSAKLIAYTLDVSWEIGKKMGYHLQTLFSIYHLIHQDS